jgi:hypothetical protein
LSQSTASLIKFVLDPWHKVAPAVEEKSFKQSRTLKKPGHFLNKKIINKKEVFHLIISMGGLNKT